MSLSDVIRDGVLFVSPALPELRYIEAAVRKVESRWPHITVTPSAREREELALQFRNRVARGDWGGVRLSFVIAAAHAVLDEERRERPDLDEARAFLYAETRASTSETLLSGILQAHLESFVPGSAHSRALADALSAIKARMSPAGRRLFEAVPEVLDPEDGPQRLATRMMAMSNPFQELGASGLRNPHGAGFMDHTHLALTNQVRAELDRSDLVDWYLAWLCPPGREARRIGAEHAIEALVTPWLRGDPAEAFRSRLIESLIEMYGDPRIRRGGVWAGVQPDHMRVLNRWLTGEDMRFFTGVVDATQTDAMWPPRRDFWLKLYDEGLIDAAWVAFSNDAAEYARQHLLRQDAKDVNDRFGWQRARKNTSLLIMKIGNKIMVDGCHSYRTHVFDQDDPMAPKLFLEGYDCDEIMRASPASKPHNSIRNWSRWVRDRINADVSWSTAEEPYSEVIRPRDTKVSRPRTGGAPYRRSANRWGMRPGRLGTEYRTSERQTPSHDTSAPSASAIRSPEPATERPPGTSEADRIDSGEPERSIDAAVPPKEQRFKLLMDRLMTPDPASAGSLADRVSGTEPVLPALPDTGPERIELLFSHAHRLASFAQSHIAVSVDRTLVTALAKLNTRSPDLRPGEIHLLQQIYELMRQHEGGRNR